MKRSIPARRLGAAVLITALWTAAAAILMPDAAAADPPGPTFATSNNSSDPHAFKCKRPSAGSVEGYCMVTSQDLFEGPFDEDGPGENYYPMSQTMGYFSPDGLNWTTSAVALTEATIGRSGTKHLWAPAVRRVKNTVGPTNPQDYYLYTPDLTDRNDKYSSKIFVTSSTDPITGYGSVNIPGNSVKFRQINGVGYMSDPEVFVDGSDPTTPSTANQYLLWADGDKDSCGGLSLRHMSSHTALDANFTDPSQAWLNIDGPLEADMGNCVKERVGGGGGGVGTEVHRPYLEGGSIFKTSNWQSSLNHSLPGPYVMVFAAKPEFTPAVCRQPGQPDSDLSVIAYATAGSVTGPWTYQGIIMCGGDSEWTNQATIEEVRDASGRVRLVLVYHDGVNTDSRNRKLRSECLLTDSRGKFLLTSRSSEGAASTSGTPAWCVAQSRTNTVALKSLSTNMYVSSPGATSQLRATGSYVGLWEQYGLNTGDQVPFYYLLSRNPGNQWVQVNRNDGNKVMTRGAAAGDWEGIRPVQAPGQPSATYNLRDSAGNFWHVNSDGNITASPGTPSSGDTSAQFRFEYLW
ncbi:hypothetical protein ACIBSW_17420 [Actinoplanes sp. NPDC049668]|uniref:hypothetical protein n=1 Tax=unclassified Actinoplanes TaxID=2626549 RepID=UPI0033AFB038